MRDTDNVWEDWECAIAERMFRPYASLKGAVQRYSIGMFFTSHELAGTSGTPGYSYATPLAKKILRCGSKMSTSYVLRLGFYNVEVHQLACFFSVISSKMSLAELTLVHGHSSNQGRHEGGYFLLVFFLPATHKIKFDLVTSAFSLLELPSAEHRLQTVASLWGKTNSMLVLIENGTLEGHRAVLEARDFILTASNSDQQLYSIATSKKEDPEGCGARVLAPCPHDQDCPRETEGFGIPCNFQARYEEPLLSQKKKSARLNYSYVVLQRSGSLPAEHDWARLIRPVLCRSGHVVCRVCCHDAKLGEFVFTKARHGRHVYRVARCSQWGDQLPISILPSTEETTQESK
ncbi:unnamed protein product [Ixodes pacificus]